MKYQKSNMTDYEFAQWLFKQDREWLFVSIKTVPPVTHFYAKGCLVALAIYDDTNCRRNLFIEL